jgi:hypothetical protein
MFYLRPELFFLDCDDSGDPRMPRALTNLQKSIKIDKVLKTEVGKKKGRSNPAQEEISRWLGERLREALNGDALTEIARER